MYGNKRLSRSATGSPKLIGTRYLPGSSDLTISISSSSVISLGALIWDDVQTLIKIFSLLVSSPRRFVFRQKPKFLRKNIFAFYLFYIPGSGLIAIRSSLLVVCLFSSVFFGNVTY